MLALNCGSSSLKCGLYRVQAQLADCLWSAELPAVHQPAPALAEVARQLAAQTGTGAPLPAPQAVVHRVVHGGPQLRQHCRIDDSVLRQLGAAAVFAPLHTPAVLAVIAQAQLQFAGLPQLACFDTSFHARMPALASTLPLPRALREHGIQRYGFHGLSCESIVQQLGPALPRRLLIAHLGNGASITAVLDGVSVDTSMGLTPSGGLIMGTRSGDLDPGLLVYLMRSGQLPDAAALEDLIDHRSGLAGISGRSADLRVLHGAAAAGDGDAQLAIAMFCAAAAKQLAAMCSVLDGVDMIVFTGGIGEHDALVRADICARLRWLGLRLDDAANGDVANGDALRPAGGLISAQGSSCALHVLPSQEDAQMARHAGALLAAAAR